MTAAVQSNDLCVYCGESTAFGARREDGSLVLKFVNRIPVDGGWGCAECSGYECDACGKLIYLDTEVRVEFTDTDGNTYADFYHEWCYADMVNSKL